MEKDEALEDMVKRITDENMHPEVEDDNREWMGLPNDFTKNEIASTEPVLNLDKVKLLNDIQKKDEK